LSGLFFGTLVVEAAEISSALIAADLALEQGERFCSSVRITSSKSKGTNYLIKACTKLADSPESFMKISTCFSGKDVQAWYNETTIKKDKFSRYCL
jgi:predicted Rossmann fold nucleotide-binding protein DprA/Smf involved in DNA uptake